MGGLEGLPKHGTIGLPGRFTKAVTTDCCANLGSVLRKLTGALADGPWKVELCVSKGTAFSVSCRRPSKAPYKNVLSFLMGPPNEPPNCCRDNAFLIGTPCPANENGPPGCSAWLNAKGSRASILSFRK